MGLPWEPSCRLPTVGRPDSIPSLPAAGRGWRRSVRPCCSCWAARTTSQAALCTSMGDDTLSSWLRRKAPLSHPPLPLSTDSVRGIVRLWRRGGRKFRGWGEQSSPHPPEISSPPPGEYIEPREPVEAGGGPPLRYGLLREGRGGGLSCFPRLTYPSRGTR